LKVDDVSPRPVPIPQAWAADRVITEHGHGPLFPSVPLDSDRRRNDNATNRVNAWLHDVVKDAEDVLIGIGTPSRHWRARRYGDRDA